MKSEDSKCLHGYSNEEIQEHFCESEESMKVCNNCMFLRYDGSSGTVFCGKDGENL